MVICFTLFQLFINTHHTEHKQHLSPQTAIKFTVSKRNSSQNFTLNIYLLRKNNTHSEIYLHYSLKYSTFAALFQTHYLWNPYYSSVKHTKNCYDGSKSRTARPPKRCLLCLCEFLSIRNLCLLLY